MRTRTPSRKPTPGTTSPAQSSCQHTLPTKPSLILGASCHRAHVPGEEGHGIAALHGDRHRADDLREDLSFGLYAELLLSRICDHVHHCDGIRSHAAARLHGKRKHLCVMLCSGAVVLDVLLLLSRPRRTKLCERCSVTEVTASQRMDYDYVGDDLVGTDYQAQVGSATVPGFEVRGLAECLSADGQHRAIQGVCNVVVPPIDLATVSFLHVMKCQGSAESEMCAEQLGHASGSAPSVIGGRPRFSWSRHGGESRVSKILKHARTYTHKRSLLRCTAIDTAPTIVAG